MYIANWSYDTTVPLRRRNGGRISQLILTIKSLFFFCMHKMAPRVNTIVTNHSSYARK